MTVHMDVEDVRAGGIRLRVMSAGTKNASQRVEGPAASAADQNPGFTAGEAGRRWQTALATVTGALERRVDWQGEQVAGSADDWESNDEQAGNRFTTVAGELPANP